ncbi:hypothetical protein AKJ51_03830 [candidate division MSBL1 archaeon SCGC-AAA382A20]|uniref:Light-independent protochlorophyllide reductase subunit B-like C-terminal domain-containing protein n=1 Tax=candidate division MSBL1 archaeon SCGC-AAA382A20 TaxID=1698280 RepID=A0A133VIU5_9EURY|nr:hypothetical protein AKJ51_03830 [candidate division MSBL1 archaeon SCGC-AAA382A20]
MIPITETETNSALNSLHKKYASEMKNLGCTQNWIKRISSDNSLVCQYRPLEPDRIINALADYLITWREKLYLPAESNVGEKREKMAVENILEYKKILHENDMGLDIYRKKFSKPMVKTIEEAAFGSEPSLRVHKNNKHTNNSGKKPEKTKKSEKEVEWTSEAESYLQEAPKFVRSKIKTKAEEKASQTEKEKITLDFIKNLRKQ